MLNIKRLTRGALPSVTFAIVAGLAMGACVGGGSTGSSCSLGTVWTETEYYGTDYATWTRQGDTSTFVMEQTITHGGVITSTGTATLVIALNGDEVTVDRTDSTWGPNGCIYTGTISADCASVSGMYECGGGTPTSSWEATIH